MSRTTRIGWVVAAALACAPLVGPAPAVAGGGPRYDVPAGYDRCPDARAWNGFFKWASVRGASCGRADAFMRTYAARAVAGEMPRRVGRWRCRIRWWRNAEGEVYASRHSCVRADVTIRFYGTV